MHIASNFHQQEHLSCSYNKISSRNFLQASPMVSTLVHIVVFYDVVEVCVKVIQKVDHFEGCAGSCDVRESNNVTVL